MLRTGRAFSARVLAIILGGVGSVILLWTLVGEVEGIQSSSQPSGPTPTNYLSSGVQTPLASNQGSGDLKVRVQNLSDITVEVFIGTTFDKLIRPRQSLIVNMKPGADLTGTAIGTSGSTTAPVFVQ